MLAKALPGLTESPPGDGWEVFDNRDKDFTLWRLGNLTPLDAKANRRGAGNRPFEEKRELYATSRFEITKKCADYEAWTPQAITQRQSELAKIACSIWRIDFSAAR